MPRDRGKSDVLCLISYDTRFVWHVLVCTLTLTSG